MLPRVAVCVDWNGEHKSPSMLFYIYLELNAFSLHIAYLRAYLKRVQHDPRLNIQPACSLHKHYLKCMHIITFNGANVQNSLSGENDQTPPGCFIIP